MTSKGKSGKNILLWFRNDLRITDNETLHKAIQRSKDLNGAMIVPFYCFHEPYFRENSRYAKVIRSGIHRSRFLLESVQNLGQNVEKNLSIDDDKPATLMVRVGDPVEQIKQLDKEYDFGDVFAQKESMSEEVSVERSLQEYFEQKSSPATVHWVWGYSLVHKDDIPYTKDEVVPNMFSPFRKRCEKAGIKQLVRRTFPRPKKDDLEGVSFFSRDSKEAADGDNGMVGHLPSFGELYGGEENVPVVVEDGKGESKYGEVEKNVFGEYRNDKRSAISEIRGGELYGLKRMQSYFWKSSGLKNYDKTRNELLGSEYSSRLSPYLALGCVSPRQIYWELIEFEKKNKANGATSSFVTELLWRDYYRFLGEKQGNNFFFKQGILKNKVIKYEWNVDMDKFNKWKDGQTGYPFVDALMRELKYTGWMPNRGRMVVASFLAKDLQLDWRMGAEWFESILLDYDVTSNWGNWEWSAGIGCDGRARYFNPVKQGVDHDPEGTYIRTWIPELKHVSNDDYRIHLPSEMTSSEQKTSKCEIGKHYPTYVCDVPVPSKIKMYRQRQEKKKAKKRGSTMTLDDLRMKPLKKAKK